jgi:hypothetical protein
MRLKVERLNYLLEMMIRRRAGVPIPPEKIKTYLDLSIRFGKPVVGHGCLTRGLSLYFFLRKKCDMDVSLCFGIGQVNGNFEGHCWLLHEGKPYLENCDPKTLFAEIYRFPQTAFAAGGGVGA